MPPQRELPPSRYDDEVPDSRPRQLDRYGLSRALGSAARELKCSGHQLLAKISGLGQGPVERAAHDIAFAVNTGLAPAAAQALRGMAPTAMAELIGEVVDGQLDQDGVTALLRERYPEPKRPGAVA